MPDCTDPGASGLAAFNVSGDFDERTYCLFQRPIQPGDAETLSITVNWESDNIVGNSSGLAVFHFQLITDRVPSWNAFQMSYFGDPDELPAGITPQPHPEVPLDEPGVKWSMPTPARKDLNGTRCITMDLTQVTRPIIGMVSWVERNGLDQGPDEATGYATSSADGLFFNPRLFTSQLPISLPVVARESFLYSTPGGFNPFGLAYHGQPFSVRKLYLAKQSEDDPTLNSVYQFVQFYKTYTSLNCNPDVFSTFAEMAYTFSAFGIASGNLVTSLNPPDPTPGALNDYYDGETTLTAPLGNESTNFEVFNTNTCTGGGSDTFNPGAYLGFNTTENSIFYWRGFLEGVDFTGPGNTFVESKTACSGVAAFTWL